MVSNCGVYAIINTSNQKLYIGSSKNLKGRKHTEDQKRKRYFTLKSKQIPYILLFLLFNIYYNKLKIITIFNFIFRPQIIQHKYLFLSQEWIKLKEQGIFEYKIADMYNVNRGTIRRYIKEVHNHVKKDEEPVI